MSALRGKVAVVTGASRGIGAATADLLARDGARVVRLARSLKERRAGEALDVRCDVTDAAQVRVAADLVQAEWGAPDILVNNAGAFHLAPFEETSTADFDAQVAANLRGPWLVAKAFVPLMRVGGGGRVVTIGSVADHVGFPGNAAYAAAKYGVRGLHEALLAEYQGSALRFTLVSPGPTDTAAWDAVDPDSRPGFTPRARMLRPEDVAAAVAFAATRPAHVQLDWLRLGPA
ncbi:MAG TPA: SDR family oxidoreductase [Gemmatimonadales bacterium]|nr:SDR family oxidoreductase [Gemmatimonadales bacterium]HRZ08843.1 SDR family oxidoreductase [Gemmatimonadales bacterium]